LHCRQIAAHAFRKGRQFRNPTGRGPLQPRLQIAHASLIEQGTEGPNRLGEAGEQRGTAEELRDVGLLGSGALGVLSLGVSVAAGVAAFLVNVFLYQRYQWLQGRRNLGALRAPFPSGAAD